MLIYLLSVFFALIKKDDESLLIMEDVMGKMSFKPSTMLSPVPVVMVSCGDDKNANIITVAWVGTVCSDPPMVYVSIRKERKSHDIIKKTGEFVINLVGEGLVRQTDFCGVKSGRDVDKFKELNLTKESSNKISAPCIKESLINIECKVVNVYELGSHDMFLAEIQDIHVDESLIDENGRINMAKADLVCYSHGEYWSLDKVMGFFGFSIASDEVLQRRMSKYKK